MAGTDYSDKKIIEDIRRGGAAREKAWEYAYKKWRNRIVGVIISRDGTRDEAIDALHEAYESFEAMVRNPGFRVKSSLRAYLITCVYRQFIRSRYKKDRASEIELNDKHVDHSQLHAEEWKENSDLKDAVMKTLENVGSRCKTILLLFINDYSMKDIAETMGFKGGEQVARNEKMKCLERYERFLRENSRILLYIKSLRNE